MRDGRRGLFLRLLVLQGHTVGPHTLEALEELVHELLDVGWLTNGGGRQGALNHDRRLDQNALGLRLGRRCHHDGGRRRWCLLLDLRHSRLDDGCSLGLSLCGSEGFTLLAKGVDPIGFSAGSLAHADALRLKKTDRTSYSS